MGKFMTRGALLLAVASAASLLMVAPSGAAAPLTTCKTLKGTVTLTPGLSTTVGPEGDATFIGITTDTTGQTIITISSSGTAITATISDAPAVITLPKTGFEASITDVARAGDNK